MNTINRKIILILSFLVVFISSISYAQTKIAVVDMQQAIEETSDGEKALGQLKALKERYQKELSDRESKLDKLKEEIIQQKDVLTKDALQKRQEDWMKQRDDAVKLLYGYQDKLMQKEQKLIAPIRDKLASILQAMADEKGYHLIIDIRAGVWFSKKSMDLTGELIRRYNSAPSKTTKTGETKAPTKTKNQ